LKSFFSNIGFTKNETRVIILIVSVLIIGSGIKYYKYFFTGDRTQYDYSKSDSEFKKLTEDARQREFDVINNDTLKQDEIEKFAGEMKADQDSLESIEKETKISKKELKLREKSINLNTAGVDELVSLAGIGESTAEKIIEYRNKKGGFRKIQDIMKVKGIGEKKFEKIREYLTIE
jgi:competence protein ComEA